MAREAMARARARASARARTRARAKPVQGQGQDQSLGQGHGHVNGQGQGKGKGKGQGRSQGKPGQNPRRGTGVPTLGFGAMRGPGSHIARSKLRIFENVLRGTRFPHRTARKAKPD